jgi:hypothetical protein
MRTQGAALPTDRRGGLDTAIGYLSRHREFLYYDQALEQGWPIATGVVEGTARHLIGDRLEITGARWGLSGAEAILKLRAIISNGDMDAYWAFHLTREHRRVHQPVTRRTTHSPPDHYGHAGGATNRVLIVPHPHATTRCRLRSRPGSCHRD